MITKAKGVEDSCPSCQKKLVCVEITYKDEVKLQWQNPEGGAHYSFDFKTKKTSCKGSTPVATPNVLTTPDFTKTDHIKLPKAQLEQIVKEASEGTDRLILVLSCVEKKCAEAGITHPAKVGMIFNQVCENRR